MTNKLTQKELDRIMTQRGIDRFKKNMKRSIDKGMIAETKPGSIVLSRIISDLSNGIEEWINEGRTNRELRNYFYLLCPSKKRINAVAAESIRCVLNNIDERQKFVSIAYLIGKSIEEEYKIAIYKKDKPKDYAQVVRKQKNPDRRPAHFRKYMKNVSWDNVDNTLRVAIGGIILMMLEKLSVVEITNVMTGPTKRQKYVSGSKDLLEWLATTNSTFEGRYPYFMPMVEKPKDWSNIFDGGYSEDVNKKTLVKTNTKNNREFLNKQDMTDFFTSVNNLQSVAYRVNTNVLETVKHFFKSEEKLACLPLRDPKPLPPRPQNIEEDKQTKINWKKEAAKIHTFNAKQMQTRIIINQVISMGEMFKDEDFYYPYRSDFRGRLYTLPQFLTYQSEDLSRALVLFADSAEVKTEQDAMWLWIHGANVWGHDKLTIEERIKWTKSNIKLFRAISQNPIDVRDWSECDKPWQALAFCFEIDAYMEAKESGKPFFTRLPVWIDGSNNGLQLFSLLIRDEAGAQATNVKANDTPQDIYQKVADKVKEELTAIKAGDKHYETAKFWLEFGINRKTTKKLVMTVPYGVSPHSAKNYTIDWYEDMCAKNKIEPMTPAKAFVYCAYLSNVILKCIKTVVSGSIDAMKWLKECASIASDQNKQISWTTPSGFMVKQNCSNRENVMVKLSYGKKLYYIHTGKFLDTVSKKRQIQGISPNFIHSIDASILHLTVNECFDQGIKTICTIHDSYGTLSTNVPKMNELLLSTICKIFKDNLMKDFKDQLEKDGIKVNDPPAIGNLNVDEVKNSVYMFS